VPLQARATRAGSAASLRSAPVVGSLIDAYERQYTQRGRYLFWATAVFALLGVDTRRSHAYVLFALAAGLLLLALAVSLSRRPRLGLACTLPARATALTPLPLHARLCHHGGPRELLLRFPSALPDRIVFRPGETFISLAPGESRQATVVLEAQRRGRYDLRGPRLQATDPLHLAAGRGEALPSQPLLVYPRFYAMERFDIPLGRRYQPGGIPLSSSTGDAIEFVGTREYREGDPVRNIHWRSWARRGEPVVKEYQEEYFCRIAIILDTFLPRAAPPEMEEGFEAAISVVASIADFFSRSEYVVDILAAGPDVYEVSAGRSLAYLENILDVLACLEPCHDPPFRVIGPYLFEKLSRLTTVVAVLQDWDEPRQELLRQVKALGTAVRAVVVRGSPTTRPWQAEDGDLGEITQMTPADVERAIAAQGHA
jgi:uncharacterized protein (DUF58 family)